MGLCANLLPSPSPCPSRFVSDVCHLYAIWQIGAQSARGLERDDGHNCPLQIPAFASSASTAGPQPPPPSHPAGKCVHDNGAENNTRAMTDIIVLLCKCTKCTHWGRRRLGTIRSSRTHNILSILCKCADANAC